MIAKRIALAAACLGLAAALHAQDSSLLTAGAYDRLSYPDYDYETHPTVLLRVKSPFDTYDGRAALESSDQLTTRLDDAVGATGGTKRERATALSGRFDYEAFRLRKAGPYLVEAYADGRLDAYDLAKDRYEKPTENAVTQTLDWPLSAGIAGSLLKASGALQSSYGLAYDFSFEPHYFTTTTDASQSPPLVKIEAAGRDADAYGHAATLKADWARKLGYLDARLAVSYRFGYTDRNAKYLSIDTNNDGVADSVRTYAEWIGLANAAGGPLNTVTSSSVRDIAFSHKADIDLLVGMSVSKSLTLLLDLGYLPLDASIRDSHIRLLDAVTLKDESAQRRVVMSDWGNASGMALFVLAPEASAVSWRFGAGYARTGYALALDGTQASGVSLYSRENPGNFVEAELGIEPINGAVATACGDPRKTVSHAVRALAAFEWKPAKAVSLLGSIGVEASRLERTYRVYNTDTRSVWQEVDTGDALTWDLSPRFCLSLPAGKKAVLSGIVGPSEKASGFSRDYETSPYDLTLSRQSSAGTVDLSERRGLSFDYTLRLTVLR